MIDNLIMRNAAAQVGMLQLLPLGQLPPPMPIVRLEQEKHPCCKCRQPTLAEAPLACYTCCMHEVQPDPKCFKMGGEACFACGECEAEAAAEAAMTWSARAL